MSKMAAVSAVRQRV